MVQSVDPENSLHSKFLLEGQMETTKQLEAGIQKMFESMRLGQYTRQVTDHIERLDLNKDTLSKVMAGLKMETVGSTNTSVPFTLNTDSKELVLQTLNQRQSSSSQEHHW